MESIRSQLLDMGFNESKVKRAIESCPEAQTLEHVMEWLIAHEHELDSEPVVVGEIKPKPVQQSNQVKKEDKALGGCTSNDGSQTAGHENETAANMAARKKITVEEAQRLITERQAQRAEEERKKEIENEKKRRLDGQKMAETRQELADQERMRLAQQIRQEKLDKERHRKEVLEQIARDREVMKNKEKNNKQSEAASTSSNVTPAKSNLQSKGASTECKIALRFPDGTSLMHKFSPQEQLAAVRLFVQMEKSCPKGTNVEFVAPPNRKLNESMMDDTLESLGLCPASRLEVKFGQQAWVDLD